jgi:3-hydroxyisobutyrate dehydrogenase-like beta-hydroxyacid dehydrogenase
MEDTVESMLKGDVKGKLFCDCSTIHPDTTRKINKSITDKGAHFVACPVFGAPAMAESGQLVCVLAGPAADVEKIKPYTKGVMGRDYIDYSDQDVGKALLMKVIGNTFVINMVETLSEGHTLADKTGLGSDNLHQFIEKMFPGPYTSYSNRLKTNDYVREEVGHRTLHLIPLQLTL